jgi:hypothetical protein
MKMFTTPRPQVNTDDLADITERLAQPTQTMEKLTTNFPNNDNNKQALALLNSLTKTLNTIINGATLEKNDITEPSPLSSTTLRQS